MTDAKLAEDKKGCRKFGPCGVGKQAIYLNSFYIDRRYYVPLSCVKRVYKRIAMSKGGFTGKGIFASIPYLVVEYDHGKKKQCNFKREEEVDQLLAYLQAGHPKIKLHSEAAEKKLLEKEKERKAKRAKQISTEATESIRFLETCRAYLEKKPGLAAELSASSRRKRTYDNSNPAYKWVALAITLLGLGALLYGIYALIAKAGFGVYFLLFGLAAIFLFSGASVLPTSRNNRRQIEGRLNAAVAAMEHYIRQYPGFPLPPRYSHPLVLKRMEDILAEGRSGSIPEALEQLKQDLKALNASVTVDQEEYEEIIAIKPMFLIHRYE